MKTHPFDAVSFISGAFITAIGLIFLIPRDVSGLIDALTRAAAWFWPVVLLAVGGAVIATSLISSRREPSRDDEAG